MHGSGRVLSPSRPVLASASIFRDDATKLALAESQVDAKKLANQLMYGVPVAKGGSFHGYEGMGYGGHPEGKNTLIKTQSYNSPIWVVPPTQPRVKVWLVTEEPLVEGHVGREEELVGPGHEANQAELEHVPIPPIAELPHGRLGAVGTDEWASIWCPATDEWWEFHRIRQFVSGSRQGEWKTGAGHYQQSLSTWNGITASSTGESCASGLMLCGGVVTMQDIVNVLRGGSIGHALCLGAIVTQNGLVAPARQHDHKPNEMPFLEDGITPNPAYVTKGPEVPGAPESEWKEGWADAVPEGTWCRFPPSSHASEYGMTRAIEVALYEAIRAHGLVVMFGAGNMEIEFADPMTLFTPYCDTNANPFNGSSEWTKYVGEGTTEAQRAGWIDGTLPTLWGGEINGTSGILANMPWRTLELLAPRSS